MAEPLHPGEIAGTRWDPTLYGRFADHRLRPALDLLARVPVQDARVVYDLGCGTGEVTRLLATRFPDATVVGIDHSKEMLDMAGKVSSKVTWQEADIRHWQPEQCADLIYSNATLHWIEDHARHLPRLIRFLNPGGCLAVQMPTNWAAPSHRLIREILASSGPEGRPFGGERLRQAVARNPVWDAPAYYDLLLPTVNSIDIWETEYLHVLEGDDAVLNWVKSTSLRPILSDLNDQDRELFLAEYRHRLSAAYPTRTDGRTLFPFRRLFMIAVLPDHSY